MGEKTYGELLKDPRWQRKRLEVFQRDGFECLQCGSRDKTLHVNHRWYKARRKPWEYDGEVLETLCEDCHKDVTKDQERIKDALTQTRSSLFGQIASYIEAGIASSEVTAISVRDYNSAQGVADHLHVTADMVVERAIGKGGLSSADVMDLEFIGAEIEQQLNRPQKCEVAEAFGTDEVDF